MHDAPSDCGHQLYSSATLYCFEKLTGYRDAYIDNDQTTINLLLLRQPKIDHHISAETIHRFPPQRLGESTAIPRLKYCEFST